MHMEKQMMIIIRGVPGSGKSTAAQTFKAVLEAIGKRAVGIFSTDDFWYSGDPAVYNWDANKLKTAHSWNQNRVKCAVMNGDHVIIDNTNVDGFAMMPYFDIAAAHDLDVMIHLVDTPIETCIDRQNDRTEDRRVPEDAIRNMHNRLSASKDLNAEGELQKAKIRTQIRSQKN